MSNLLGFIAYHMGLGGYVLLVHIASLFNQKARLAVKGRKNLLAHIEKAMTQEHRPSIWFHCASLGEFEQIRPLLEQLKVKKANHAIVVTFFSPSGYEIRKNYHLADYVFYLPFDSATNARRFIRLIRPDLVFFAKYELWYHYLTELSRNKIRTILVSANFRKDQVYFRWYGIFFRNILFAFEHIFSQFEASTLLLKEAGIAAASTAGDTRYDRVYEASLAPLNLPTEVVRKFKDNAPLLVLGSSYGVEEEIALQVLRQFPELKLIIAPHHVEESRISNIEAMYTDYTPVRYSAAEKGMTALSRVLIIDSVGLLAGLYRYAEFALVGGGFGKGGIHNILEPIASGCITFLGPVNHAKFPETALAEEAGVLFTVRNHLELTQQLSRFTTNLRLLNENQAAARQFIASHAGATATILNTVC